MAKVEICTKEKENSPGSGKLFPGDRKLRHNDDSTVRSTAMSCNRQKRKAKEEVDKKDIGDRFAAVGNAGASEKFQRDLECV